MGKVLIADDDPDILELLRQALEQDGHETLLASDGRTALKRIEAEAPDAVLLDIMMPVLDGWEVLEAVAAAASRKKPRVIVVTAKANTSELVKALELGACEYVTKPFEIQDLITTVAKVLAGSDAEVSKHREELLRSFSK